MKHIYVFQALSRGALYGIGTYIEQLVEALRSLDLRLTVVRYYSSFKLMSVTVSEGVRYIEIPRPACHDTSLSEEESAYRYGKALVITLIPFIDKTEENVFHLNYSNDLSIAKYLKEYFDCSVIKTVHYTQWSFQLTGDRRRFIKLLHQDPLLLDPSERALLDSFQLEKETIVKYCDRVVAISQHSYMDLLTLYGVDEGKLFLVSNAIKDVRKLLSPKQRGKLRMRFGMKEDEISIVFAGRLDEVKGVFVLLRALEYVLEKHKNVRLYIAGDGVISQLLHSGNKVCSNVSYTGFLKKKDLYELLMASDIGVVPSLHEEFGYVAIEMMMLGLPVIVSNSTGLAEIVENEVSGVTTSILPGKRNFLPSAKNLAHNILRLVEDQDLRRKLSLGGRSRYESEYDIGPFLQKMKTIYSKV